MSYSFQRVDRRQGSSPRSRSALGYWVPLAVSVTAVSIGVVAWIWSERKDGDDSSSSESGGGRPYQPSKPDSSLSAGVELPPEASRDYRSASTRTRQQTDEGGVIARMSGALRRSPSPQQIFDGASKKVAAGVAAAGTAVSGALSSIREEDRDDYADHSRWSQEAAARNLRSQNQQSTEVVGQATGSYNAQQGRYSMGAKQKIVAVVLSADTAFSEDDGEIHASLLTYLPSQINPASTRLYILIHSPDLKHHPLSSSDPTKPLGSRTSSFSNIGHEDVRTPGEEIEKPLASVDPHPMGSSSSGADTPNTPALSASASPAFNALYAQAQKLVEKDNMILPFTSPSSFLQQLRHLSPDIVYIQESLTGPGGEAVANMHTWVSRIVVVVGAEGSHGGLVDTEDEDDKPKDSWWKDSDMIGIGKGVEIVDGIRLGEHWSKRVDGQD